MDWLARLQPAFNRTNMELKCHGDLAAMALIKPFNRTNMELKLKQVKNNHNNDHSFNRTNMELKWRWHRRKKRRRQSRF